MNETALEATATWVQVVASLLSVVLALVGLRIARAAAREQKANRDYAMDRALADEFFQAVDQIVADIERQRIDVMTASSRFRHALSGWSRRVTQPASQEQRNEVESFLRELEREAAMKLPADRSAQIPLLDWMGYTGALRRAQQITRAWSSPEARREVLTRILHERAEDMQNPRSSPGVQAQRWLLMSDPAPGRAARFWGSVRVSWLMFADDVKRGRVRQTFREWVVYQQGARAERLAFRAELKRAEQARAAQEKAALNRDSTAETSR